MSKSFDLCKATAQNTYRSSHADRNWDNAVEYGIDRPRKVERWDEEQKCWKA